MKSRERGRGRRTATNGELRVERESGCRRTGERVSEMTGYRGCGRWERDCEREAAAESDESLERHCEA